MSYLPNSEDRLSRAGNPFSVRGVSELFDVSEIGGPNGLKRYLKRILNGTATWFHASGASIFLRTSNNGEYCLAAKSGVDSRVPTRARIHESQGIAGAAIAKGVPLLLHNGVLGSLRPKDGERPDIGSSMIIPLMAAKRSCVGVLNVSRRKGEHRFSKQDLEMARMIAGHVALAVSNAGLFARLKSALAEADALRAKQEETSRMRRLAELGQMAASIAHEIRNPLTGIRGAAQVIRDSPDQAKEFARIIEDEAVKLNSICEDFLDFARPIKLSKRPTHLNVLVQAVAGSMRAEFRFHKVSLRVHSKRPEPIIHVDPLRVEQVLRNLLLNALQACKPGEHVQIKVTKTGFEVADDGIGMNKSQLASIFAPFYTTKPKGTGLGLSNVRKILDAHDAAIEVSSKQRKGTKVLVRFPEGESS